MGVNLSIKGVADDVAEKLRRRAESNHRSLQGELMAIIEQAALSAPAIGAAEASPAAPVSRRAQGWKTVEDLIEERRRAPFATTPGLPLAMDIIRADRDSR